MEEKDENDINKDIKLNRPNDEINQKEEEERNQRTVSVQIDPSLQGV